MGNYRDLMSDRGPGRLPASQEDRYVRRQVGACRRFYRCRGSCNSLRACLIGRASHKEWRRHRMRPNC